MEPTSWVAINVLADDRDTIPYRKRLNEITGSVTATILLQQMIYWDKKNGYKPFYKFRGPCKHAWYKKGDSWTEELGFSPAEFDNAVKKIGTKITKGKSKSEAFNGTTPKHLIIYWTDANRVTWYQVNRELLGNFIISIYLEDRESRITYKSKNPELPYSETTPETTPETTTEEGGGKKTPPVSPPDTHSPTDLPTSEAQMAMLFPSGGSSKIYDYERSIATTGWDISRADIRRAAALFLRASGLPIPNDDSTRGDWIKDLNQHVNDYGVIVLKELYPATIERMRDGDDPMMVCRPGSVTKTLAAVCADLKNGGTNGPNSNSSGRGSQPSQSPGVTGHAAKVGEAIKSKSRGNSH